MTKARYRYRRYLVYLPISVGNALDTSIDYEVKLVDKLIVIMPKLGDVASTITRIEDEWRKSQRNIAETIEPAENDQEP